MSENQKRYTIIIHDDALKMFSDHIQFVSNVSVPASRKLRNTIYNAIESLGIMPLRCPVYHTHDTSDSYRQLIAGRYKIIFDVDEKDMIVNINYILDSRQKNDF